MVRFAFEKDSSGGFVETRVGKSGGRTAGKRGPVSPMLGFT